MMQIKTCGSCGEAFVTNPKYSLAQQAAARYCSRTCHAAGLAVERPFCACGCGDRVKETWRRYLAGHAPGRGIQKPLQVRTIRGKTRWYISSRAGYVVFARAVMEVHLRRELLPTEVVDHVNGDSTDDRIENLLLYPSHSEHMRAEHRRGRFARVTSS
jgi:hypothetical protein